LSHRPSPAPASIIIITTITTITTDEIGPLTGAIFPFGSHSAMPVTAGGAA
jgi:hypothetical protein